MYCVTKTKTLISCAVTAQLICVCFCIGKYMYPFSHDMAQILILLDFDIEESMT